MLYSGVPRSSVLPSTTTLEAGVAFKYAHAAYLNATPASKVIVEGNTDERGTPEYNIALGQRRADAVKGFLAGKGVDAGKVSTVSYGEEKPAVLGHDEAAYSKNRRAVLAY